MKAGLVFVRTCDALARVILSISKQEYNLIGIYIVDKNQHHLFYLYEINSMEKVTFEKKYLEELIDNPLIERISLKPFVQHYPEIKSIIRKHFSKIQKFDIKRTLYNIFGYKHRNKNINYNGLSMDIFNHFLKELDIDIDQVDKKESEMKIQLPDNIDSSSKGKVDLLSKFAALLNQVNYKYGDYTLQSYLNSSKSFESLIDLDIPLKDPLKVEIERNRYLEKQQKYINSLCSTLFDLILKNRRFFETLVLGFNHGQQVNLIKITNTNNILQSIVDKITHYLSDESENNKNQVVSSLNILESILGGNKIHLEREEQTLKNQDIIDAIRNNHVIRLDNTNLPEGEYTIKVKVRSECIASLPLSDGNFIEINRSTKWEDIKHKINDKEYDNTLISLRYICQNIDKEFEILYEETKNYIEKYKTNLNQ